MKHTQTRKLSDSLQEILITKVMRGRGSHINAGVTIETKKNEVLEQYLKIKYTQLIYAFLLFFS
jgi:hypothetical protein